MSQLFPKINCVFHPQQILTNFCVQKHCLLPLCPTCIKIHTIQHISLKTNPKYQQINELMSEVCTQIKQCGGMLSNHLKSIYQIEDNKRRHKETLVQKLQNIKRQILRCVENYFQQIQNEIDKVIKQLDLGDQIDKFKKAINKHVQSFKLLQQSLYSKKAMRTVIKFKGQNVKQKTQYSNKITKDFLNKCQNSLLILDLQNDFKSSINNCLKNLVLLRSNNSYSTKCEPLDITQTLAQIRDQGSISIPNIQSSIGNNKIQKRNSKNNILESITIDHNRSKRSMSEQGKSFKGRPGLHLVHLQQQFESNGNSISYNNNLKQKKVSFNRNLKQQGNRQNIGDYSITLDRKKDV